MSTQEVGDILGVEQVAQDSWNIQELHKSIIRDRRVWSWGANSYKVYKDQVYTFKVQGYLLKGFVHITLAFNDTFTVYFTNLKGKIIDRVEMVYIEDLLDTIDTRVETVDNYGQK